MNIIKLILANWDSVLIVVVFVALLIFLLIRGNKKIVFKILYSLVTEAEKQYGGGTGALKQATVIKWMYDRLPAVVRVFVTIGMLERWVDEVVEQAKVQWERNVNLSRYIDGTE